MKLLLDTHVFLWLNLEPEKCSERFLGLCANSENSLYFSYASAWEVQIKHQLNKLPLEVPLWNMIESNLVENGLHLLPIELAHIYALDSLPSHHKDPFDRLLIAQAIHGGMILVSADRNISRYPVEVILP